MTPSAYCLSPGCPWVFQGPTADLEARRHGEQAGHPTGTSLTGAVR